MDESKIILSKFTKADFPHYFQLVNDEKVMEMITERAIGLTEAKANFERLLENNALHSCFGNFKIIDATTNQFIGLAMLQIETTESEEAELGFMLLPMHWGKGIGSRVASQLIEIGRTQSCLKSIFAIIDPKNLSSRKILINNGFASVEYKEFDGLPGELLRLQIMK